MVTFLSLFLVFIFVVAIAGFISRNKGNDTSSQAPPRPQSQRSSAYDKRSDAKNYGTVINPKTTSWAYPDEILPVESITMSKSPEEFEKELNARYKVVQDRHRKNIASIFAPEIDHIVPIHYSSLHPSEIIFLWYINGKPTNNPKIGVYWRLDYGISNYQAVIEKLIRGGLLAVSSNSSDYLKRLTVAQLAELCESNGISKSGKKQEIIDRLLSGLSKDSIDKMANSQATFVLTSSGKEAVAANPEFIVYHKNRSYMGPNRNLYNLQRAVRSRPDEDMLIVLLEASGQTHAVAKRTSAYVKKSSKAVKQR